MADEQEEEIKTVTLSRWASSRVTAVLSIGIFINLTLVYLLTNAGQAIFHRSSVVRTYFDDGTGLVRTADVLLDGITVGEVKSVRLNNTGDTSRAIEVRMNIRNDFLKSIPADSQTEITADNLVGDKYINIKRGQSKRMVEGGQELARVPPTPNFDPSDLIASLSSTLQRTSTLLDQIEDPTTPLGNLVNGEEFYFQVRDDIKLIQDTVEKYGGPKSEFGQAIYGQDLYNQLRKPILDIDKQLADIQNGQRPYGPMLKDSSQYDNALQKVRNLRDSIRRMKASPMMASDDQYRNAVAFLKDLNAALNELTNGQGKFAQLLSDTQLYESLNGSGREMSVFLREFRLNPQKYLRLKVF